MDRRGEKRVPRRELAAVRELAVNAMLGGMHPDDVAKLYDVGRSSVYGWRKEYLDKGPAAFTVNFAPGRAPKLTDGQMAQVRKWVVGNNPRQLQFDFALWTRQMVRDLIKREFGVEYTLQAIGVILHRLGLSPQKPLVRAYQQNPELVSKWKREEYPEIQKAAKEAGGTILFGDEASIRTDYHAGTTWAPVGQTPIVRGSGGRDKTVNMISAVSARGKFHFSFLEGNLTSELFIGYLKDLMNDIPGPIFLIVDNVSAHKSKATLKFVQSTSGRLNLYFLPPYSPELNPDEWVWKSVKHDHVGKMASRSADEMRGGIMKVVEKLRSGPEIIRSFFGDPDLSYIEISVQ